MEEFSANPESSIASNEPYEQRAEQAEVNIPFLPVAILDSVYIGVIYSWAVGTITQFHVQLVGRVARLA